MPQRLERHTFARDIGLLRQLLLEFTIVEPKLARFRRVLEQKERAVKRERLFQEVVCAQLGGTHRRLDCAVAGDNHDLRRRGQFQCDNAPKNVKAIAVRQPDIEQHYVVLDISNQFECFRGGAGTGDGVPLFVEDALE